MDRIDLRDYELTAEGERLMEEYLTTEGSERGREFFPVLQAVSTARRASDSPVFLKRLFEALDKGLLVYYPDSHSVRLFVSGDAKDYPMMG